jgi:hypothetical protein
MRMGKTKSRDADRITELLKDLLITELGRAGVPQPVIRKIVGCDMNRVSRIVKNFGRERGRGRGQGATS